MLRRVAAVALLVGSGGTFAAVAQSTAAAQSTVIEPMRGPAATAATTTLAGSPDFDPVDFFADLFAQVNENPREPGDLAERVVGGSPAAAWVTYLLGFGAARVDSRHGPFEPFTVDATTTALEDNEAVEVCNDGFCDTFGDFAVTNGRLRSFTLNGVSVDDRLAAPSNSTTFGPVDVRVVGAFERVTVDELAVVVALQPVDEEVAVDWEQVAYVDPDGQLIAVDLQASAYPEVIGPSTDKFEQAVVVQFPTAQLGGELRFSVTTGSASTPLVVRVTVEALRP